MADTGTVDTSNEEQNKQSDTMGSPQRTQKDKSPHLAALSDGEIQQPQERNLSGPSPNQQQQQPPLDTKAIKKKLYAQAKLLDYAEAASIVRQETKDTIKITAQLLRTKPEDSDPRQQQFLQGEFGVLTKRLQLLKSADTLVNASVVQPIKDIEGLPNFKPYAQGGVKRFFSTVERIVKQKYPLSSTYDQNQVCLQQSKALVLKAGRMDKTLGKGEFKASNYTDFKKSVCARFWADQTAAKSTLFDKDLHQGEEQSGTAFMEFWERTCSFNLVDPNDVRESLLLNLNQPTTQYMRTVAGPKLIEKFAVSKLELVPYTALAKQIEFYDLTVAVDPRMPKQKKKNTNKDSLPH